MSISLAGLSACASIATTSPEITSTPQRPGALSPQSLAAGECGLFVWTSDANKRFILFTQAQRSRAVWRTAEGETKLSVETRQGEPKQGEHPNQKFRTPKGKRLSLDLRSPDPISNGTRYRTGTLTDIDDNGWTRIIPVVGLSACQIQG